MPTRTHLLFPATIALLLTLLGSHGLQANNIEVNNMVLTGNNGDEGYCFVEFDIAWENSWRGGGVTNWDAAWVFVKYRHTNGSWGHARLGIAGHTAPTGSLIETGSLSPGTAYHATTNPVIGVFMRRDAPGSGTFTANGTALRWNYVQNGLNFNDITEVRVMAIEMVFVTEGAFAVGTFGTETLSYFPTTIDTPDATTDPTPGAGSLIGDSGGYPSNTLAPLNSNWPNGYRAFYCMKYEISQQQYVDFLNTLTYGQQLNRTTTPPNSPAGTSALNSTNANRNGIDVQIPGIASTTPAVYACNLNGNSTYGEFNDGQNLPCNWLSWGDLTAYLDWSGLRPMTDLEFEKACRGIAMPVPNEFPWGTTGIATSTYTYTNIGTPNEGINANYSLSAGNANYSGTTGPLIAPLRVGIFAANAGNNGRVTSGASFYGIMELGGSLWEMAATVAAGQYAGEHGNGLLTATGQPNVTNWPPPTTAQGTGLRGGSFTTTASRLQVSDKNNGNFAGTNRTQDKGGRGVRSAP